MHEGEIATDPALVRRLLSSQFPDWAELPATLVSSFGTDHDIYRLGEHLAVRLPRIDWATEQAPKEAEWLPRLAPHLPLAVPTPLALGRPEHGYPFPWAVHEWLPGENATGGLHDLDQAAVDLARFITALGSVATDGAPPRRPGARGGRLAEHDERVRRALAAL
ncbi:MAG: putative phosphotransferase, partial [uncultured Blastococcus sp.]